MSIAEIIPAIKGTQPAPKIHPKQRLLNFVETRKYINYRFYETDHFYNVELLMAPEHALTDLILEMPRALMFHINATTNRFEIFIDKS